jgi:hypothetical protein
MKEKKQLKKSKNQGECEKKAQTSLIVTVLLILIAIAGVVLIASWVIPLIKENLSNANMPVGISIDREGSFYNTGTVTCEAWNQDMCDGVSDPRTYVKVDRVASDNSKLVGIKFIFSVGSSNIVYINKNVPAPSEYRTYVFALSGASQPSSVKIAPVILSGSNEKTLEVSDEASLSLVNTIISLEKLEYCSTLISSTSDLPAEPPANWGC